ncbi:MAG: pseudouridine synthase [Hydrogenoanaerobacterium sp.]
MKPERLDKILAAQSTASRSDIKELVRGGMVAVNGVAVKTADYKIDIEKDSITLRGEPVVLRQHIYVMLNKPQGVVSATRDGREKTVLDIIPEELMRDGLFPAGRLDKDTTGFVLITDDGEFAHRILSPKKHVAKTYTAQLSSPIDDELIKQFEEGFALDMHTSVKPARVKILKQGSGEYVEVVLTEGMYHQIKRMFEHFGRTVLRLHRTRIGGLFLDEALKPGCCRLITTEELNLITSNTQ